MSRYSSFATHNSSNLWDEGDGDGPASLPIVNKGPSVDKAKKTPPPQPSGWFTRNAFLLFLIGVGLLGIGLALMMFIEPCAATTTFLSQPVITNVSVTVTQNITTYENVTTVVNVTTVENFTTTETVSVKEQVQFLSPIQIVTAIDGSGSLQTNNGFATVRTGATEFINVFNQLTTEGSSAMEVGVTQWSHEPPVTEISIGTVASSEIGQQISLIPHRLGGTSFATALYSCAKQLLDRAPIVVPAQAEFNVPTSQLCMVMSDGVNYDSGVTFTSSITLSTIQSACNGDTGCEASTIRQGIAREIGGWCVTQQVPSCTTTGIAEFLNNQGIRISGIYIGGSAVGQSQLFSITTCAVSEPATSRNDCKYFSSTDLNSLRDSAEALADGLVNDIGVTRTFEREVSEEREVTVSVEVPEEVERTELRENVEQVEVEEFRNISQRVIPEEICTGDGIWFFFLAMFLPLAVYLLFRPFSLFMSRYCCPPRDAVPMVELPSEEIPLYTPFMTPTPVTAPSRSHPSVGGPPPVPSRVNHPVIPEDPEEYYEPPEPNTLVKSKRYKWSIRAADAYLWNLGGAGCAPLTVDFNGVAPPSAPKAEANEENMKRRTQRISLRWSYIPENDTMSTYGDAAGNRASRRVTQRITSMMGITPMTMPVRQEPYEQNEIQPGDIDYEYTMCLMSCCPCLRPKTVSKGEAEVIMQKKHMSQSNNPVWMEPPYNNNQTRATPSLSFGESAYNPSPSSRVASEVSLHPALSVGSREAKPSMDIDV